MAKFKNKNTNEVFNVKTPNLIDKYKASGIYVEIKKEESKSENKDLNKNK